MKLCTKTITHILKCNKYQKSFLIINYYLTINFFIFVIKYITLFYQWNIFYICHSTVYLSYFSNLNILKYLLSVKFSILEANNYFSLIK